MDVNALPAGRILPTMFNVPQMEDAMTRTTSLTLATLFFAAGLTAAGAQTAQDHNAHHPATLPQVEDAAGASPASEKAATPMSMGAMMSGGMGQMMGMMQSMTAMPGAGVGAGMAPFAHIEGRIAFLKTELGITDAQLPQWNAFADALRAGAKGTREAMANVMQSGPPST